MKNLKFKNYDVLELSQEEKMINGGNPAVWLLGAFAGSFLYGVVEDWEGNVNSFKEAYHAGRNR